MTQVFLHIGMHKTGSTAIQKRLEANQDLLVSQGICFDDDSKNQLKKATRRRQFAPWKQKLRDAQSSSSALLISNEVLSHLLADPMKTARECPGDWLTRAFQEEGCTVSVIAFLRDQPSYLNSQYTQHVKKFALGCSFERYARRMMNHSQARGECDPQRLFGWVQNNPSIQAHFVPFGGASAGDPFQQLLERIDVSSDLPWRPLPRVNEQPGRLAVATAVQVQQQLADAGRPLSNRATRKQAFRLLKSQGQRRQWSKDRFNGLTPALYREIRSHYQASNDRFARQVWGATDWAALFPEQPPRAPQPLSPWERWVVARASNRIIRHLN